MPDMRVSELLDLLEQYAPTQPDSPYSIYLPGFSMLRLLLTKDNKTQQESDLISTVLESYASYQSSGRRDQEIACLTARDFMVLFQSSNNNNEQAQLQQQIKSNALSAQQSMNNLQGMQNFAPQTAQSMQQHHNMNGLQHLGSLGSNGSSSLLLNQSSLGAPQSFMGMQQKQGGGNPLHLNNLVQQRSNQPQSFLPSPLLQGMQHNNGLQFQNLSLPGSQHMNPIMMGSGFHQPHQH